MNFKKRSLLSFILRSFFSNLSITNWIILANAGFFVIASIASLFNSNFLGYIALKPESILHGRNLWTLLTSVFMHASFLHLFFNMFSLFFIGTFIEKIIGRKRFLIFYIISGIIGSLLFAFLPYLFQGNSIGEKLFGTIAVYGVGASGAIFGLLGLLAVLAPRAKAYLIAGPLIAIIVQAVIETVSSSNYLAVLDFIVNIYFFISIFAIISFNSRMRRFAIPVQMPFWLLPFIAIVPLLVIGFFIELPIGNSAHIGGLLAGLAYGFYLRQKYKNKVLLLNRMFG